MAPAIECSGLTFRYGTTPGILDLDLAVGHGEVFGFLGPNGAGKTTTIRLLLDLLRPERGIARVLGQEARRGGGELRRRIGYLPGELHLFDRATGLENLDLFSRLQGRPPLRRDEVLDRLGFPRAALSRRARTYSTGMRQAVGIAIAFQHDPELLILDEPTTGLDPLVREAVLGLLGEAGARGATVFLSSHVLAEVDRVADRVGLISEARLRLVEGVAALRARFPRRVRVRLADGSVRESGEEGPIGPLLERLAAMDPQDVEIAPPTLDEVFRAFVPGRPRP